MAGGTTTMNIPVFIDISLEEQALEVRRYLSELGAEISCDLSSKGVADDLHKIIGVCDIVLSADDPALVQDVLNGIVSMLGLVPEDKSETLIVAFCEKLAQAPNDAMANACLKVLWTLYQSLHESSPMRFHVYYYLVQLAGKVSQVDVVFKDLDTLKAQLDMSKPSNDQVQKLLRLLHQVLLNEYKSEQASEVMIMLLATYTSENANQVREEAQRCIIASLADPQTFLLDHLLQLKPVKYLEGDLIHDLLKIFVSENLAAYEAFYAKHREFVQKVGLSHEDNVRKMQLLTFMQLAEARSQISFAEIQKHTRLEEDQIEDFFIDLLKTRLVRAKLDQSGKVVYVSSTMHRTFTRQDWNSLHGLLTAWKSNLHTVKDQIGQLSNAQVEIMRQQQQDQHSLIM